MYIYKALVCHHFACNNNFVGNGSEAVIPELPSHNPLSVTETADASPSLTGETTLYTLRMCDWLVGA